MVRSLGTVESVIIGPIITDRISDHEGWDQEAGEVQNFKGQMFPHGTDDHYTATIAVDGEWVRVWHEHKRVGAWPVENVNCERVTVFRFQLTLDEVLHTFQPEDPAGFADGIGAVIDLRPKSRFGLGPRVKAAKEEMAAVLDSAAAVKSTD